MKRYDLDDCHDYRFCVLLKATLNVQANMFEPQNGQSQIQCAQSKPKGKYTGERIPAKSRLSLTLCLSVNPSINRRLDFTRAPYRYRNP